PVATTLVGKSVFPEDHPLALGLGVYPRSRYATGPALHINRRADVVLAVGNSYRLPNGTDGRPIPPGVKLIHINADAVPSNKTYRAHIVFLADAKRSLRDLMAAVRDRRGPGQGGVKPAITAEIQRARAKWLEEWRPVFTDPAAPTNGYRVIYDLMHVIERHKTIAIPDPRGSRGYLAPFFLS